MQCGNFLKVGKVESWKNKGDETQVLSLSQ